MWLDEPEPLSFHSDLMLMVVFGVVRVRDNKCFSKDFLITLSRVISIVSAALARQMGACAELICRLVLLERDQ